MEKPLLLPPARRNYPGLLAVFLLLTAVLAANPALSQSSVKGKLTDEAGTGMPGVNILLKGTTIGTTSDAAGNYSVNVPGSPEQALIVFSFIGYTTQELTLNGRTIIDVAMVPSLVSLTEVVVVGYG